MRGVVLLHSQDEAVRFFRLLSDHATKQVCAVDFVSLRQWRWNRRLYEYLEGQLARATETPPVGTRDDGFHLHRIRPVSRRHDLEDPERRALLRQFASQHEAALRARLWLCPKEDQGYRGTIFSRSTGCVLIDSGEHAACVRATLDAEGVIDSAEVFLQPIEPVRDCERQFWTLVERIEKGHLHEQLYEELFAPRDDDVELRDWSDRDNVAGDLPIGIQPDGGQPNPRAGVP